MKVLVIGAAGKTGKEVVRQAVERGHTVTAFVHDMSGYDGPGGVQVLEGDALDLPTVESAMRGQEAVVDALGGHTPWKETSLETNAARRVIEAMQQHGVRRLLVVSAIGVGDTKDLVPGWYERLIMPTLLRGAMQDKEHMEPVVAGSDLDWTLVRPGHLVDGERKDDVEIVADHARDPGHEIRRSDLAAFLLDLLESGEHVRESVNVVSRQQ